MSKSNAMIKKKALEHVKKREWDQAVREYLKLAENEKHNPNVFNELGDLFLKIGNKGEAFTAFHTAVDEYSRNTLYNNAVAVCKKILRLNPGDRRVNGKLARLRAKQGFAKEAATYAITFIDQIASNPAIGDDEAREDLVGLFEVMGHAPEVLELIADGLAARQLNEDAGRVLAELFRYYADRQMTGELDRTRKKMQRIGVEPPSPGASPSAGEKQSPTSSASTENAAPEPSSRMPAREEGPPPSSAPKKTGPVYNVPSTPYDYGTIDLGAAPTATEELPGSETQDAQPGSRRGRRPAASTEIDIEDAYDAASAATAPEPGPPEPPVTPEPEPEPETEQFAAIPDDEPDEVTPDAPENAVGSTDGTAPELKENEVWIPNEELPNSLKTGAGDGTGEVVQVEDIIGQFDAEVTADVDAGDYRSHYDLGMAYLEMDLLPEAIREFQFAANSSMYQVRCLEMIGLCFLKQNQPRLAIKQLERGLGLVGDVDKESLGLQYNLGLAHEMLGDTEKAKIYFEDVYVIDVTFRDVKDKVKKYSS